MTLTGSMARQYSFYLSFVWQELGFAFVGLALLQFAGLCFARRGAATRLGAYVTTFATAVVVWLTFGSAFWLFADSHVRPGHPWLSYLLPFGVLLAACGGAAGVTTILYLRARLEVERSRRWVTSWSRAPELDPCLLRQQDGGRSDGD